MATLTNLDTLVASMSPTGSKPRGRPPKSPYFSNDSSTCSACSTGTHRSRSKTRKPNPSRFYVGTSVRSNNTNLAGNQTPRPDGSPTPSLSSSSGGSQSPIPKARGSKSPSPGSARSRSPSPGSSGSRSRSGSSSKSRSPSPGSSRSQSTNSSGKRKRGIKNPYLKRISDNELRYDYPPHSLSFKLQNGKFKGTRVPNKVCRILTSHCTKRHPLLRDQKPRHTKIQLRQL